MFNRAGSCDVKGGRIRVCCPRCKKIAYVAVLSDARRKTVRCSCGKSSFYTLNYRGAVRESIAGKAQVIFNGSQKAPVYLCDTSPLGMGFKISRDFARSLNKGQEVRISSTAGSASQRKLVVKNINGNRIGAEFIDGCAKLMMS